MDGMTRRGMLGKAAVGVGVAWVAPTVLSMPASAEGLIQSPPPKPPHTNPPTDPLPPEYELDPPVDDELPDTGLDIRIPLIAGTGLIAAGTAITIISNPKEPS